MMIEPAVKPVSNPLIRMLVEETRTDTCIEQLIKEIDEITEEEAHRAILYNDDFHVFNDVVTAVQIATGKSYHEAFAITSEAHNNGKAICYTGDHDGCTHVARILRNAGLLVEVD